MFSFYLVQDFSDDCCYVQQMSAHTTFERGSVMKGMVCLRPSPILFSILLKRGQWVLLLGLTWRILEFTVETQSLRSE